MIELAVKLLKEKYNKSTVDTVEKSFRNLKTMTEVYEKTKYSYYYIILDDIEIKVWQKGDNWKEIDCINYLLNSKFYNIIKNN